MQEIITTGKTVDEAVEAACAQLGLSRDDVSVEILEMPQKKLFGSKPAKVRVTKLEDDFDVKALFEEKPQPKAEEKKQERPKKEKKEKKPAEPKAEPLKEAEEAAEAVEEKEEAPLEEIAFEDMPVSAQTAMTYLKDIANGMGAKDLTYKAVKTERGIQFVVDGDDASLLIGRRGETLDALQYLTTLACNRCDADYSKVSLDVANYRKKREKTLRALAEKEAAKVKKSRYSKTLEPMNPYERRIVHSAIQEIEGVTSESVGSEPNRRVVISLVSGGKTRSRRDGKDGGSRRGRNDRDRKPRNTAPRETAPAPAQNAAPKTETDDFGGALYGRIEL